MKNLFSLFMLLCLFANTATSQNLTVATFNLRGDDPGDVGNLWTDRKLMVTDQIEKYGFDLMGLQETNANMAGYLMTQIPQMDSLGVFVNIGTGILFNASRLQPQYHGYFWLSATPDIESKGWDAKFKRVCVWAKFKDLANGMEFYAFNTHFDHVGVVARKNSIELVLQRVADIAGSSPTVVMGDFNFAQYDTNYTTINNSGILKDTKHLALINREKERGSGNGFDIDRRDRTRVDHIFVTDTWKADLHDVLLDLYNGHTSSDHYSVMSIIGQKAGNLGDLYRQFPEDFENPNPIKTGYATGDVVLRTGTWTLNNATMGGSRSNDQNTSGTYGVRMAANHTASAYLQMNFDVTEGASKVTIEHSTYATDSISKWQLEYSINQGLTWITTGPVVVTHQLNKQQATFIMDIAGNVRFRINKLGISATNNGRLSVDDFTIYKRRNARLQQKIFPLLAWQFATPSTTGREISANATVNNSALNISVITRGSGFRTTTGSSANINLTNGFAAAASVASSLYASDTTIALNNNLYFQFQVNPKTAREVSLSTIDAKLVSTGSTLKLWYWKYSLDGVNYKFLAKSYLFNATSPTSQATVDLSAYPELQHITSDKTVYFRLYVNGTNAADEIVGIGTSDPSTTDDYVLSVGGTTSEAVPVSKLVAWQFASPATAGSEVTKSASIVNAAVTATPLERGAGLTRTNSYYSTPIELQRAFSTVTSVTTAATLEDTAVAIANNMYFAYSVKVNPGYRLSLSSLDYKIRISGGGAKVWYWKYSLDSVTFKKLTNPVQLAAATPTEGAAQPSIDLTSIAELQLIPAGTTVYFRLYTNGSNNTSGTTAIGRSANGSSTDYVLALNGNADTVIVPTKLVAWQFATPQKVGSETSITATTVESGVTATSLVRGGGLTATGLARSFAALTPIISSVNISDTITAINNGMYFGFSVSPSTGKIIHLKGLDYKIRASGGGAKVYYWKYSFNGTDFFKIENPQTLAITTNGEGELMPSVDLSGIATLQNIHAGTTVYFRLYTNGSNNTTGSTSIGRSATGSTEDVLWLSGNTEDETMFIESLSLRDKKYDNVAESFKIGVSAHQLILFTVADKADQADFMLTNLQGQVLMKKRVRLAQGSNVHIIPCNYQHGMYIGTLSRANREKISLKIVL